MHCYIFIVLRIALEYVMVKWLHSKTVPNRHANDVSGFTLCLLVKALEEQFSYVESLLQILHKLY